MKFLFLWHQELAGALPEVGSAVRDGRIILRIEAGRIASVDVAPNLDSTYADLYKRSLEELLHDPDDLSAATAAVIFGAFFVEARCNNMLKIMLQREVPESGAATILWNAMRRKSVPEKVALIAEFLPDHPAPRSPSIQALFECRNRLAHYVDDPIQVRGGVEKEDLVDVLVSVPEHNLIQALRHERLRPLLETVDVVDSWLREIESAHSSKHGITSEVIPGPSDDEPEPES